MDGWIEREIPGTGLAFFNRTLCLSFLVFLVPVVKIRSRTLVNVSEISRQFSHLDLVSFLGRFTSNVFKYSPSSWHLHLSVTWTSPTAASLGNSEFVEVLYWSHIQCTVKFGLRI